MMYLKPFIGGILIPVLTEYPVPHCVIRSRWTSHVVLTGNVYEDCSSTNLCLVAKQ